MISDLDKISEIKRLSNGQLTITDPEVNRLVNLLSDWDWETFSVNQTGTAMTVTTQLGGCGFLSVGMPCRSKPMHFMVETHPENGESVLCWKPDQPDNSKIIHPFIPDFTPVSVKEMERIRLPDNFFDVVNEYAGAFKFPRFLMTYKGIRGSSRYDFNHNEGGMIYTHEWKVSLPIFRPFSLFVPSMVLKLQKRLKDAGTPRGNLYLLVYEDSLKSQYGFEGDNWRWICCEAARPLRRSRKIKTEVLSKTYGKTVPWWCDNDHTLVVPTALGELRFQKTGKALRT